MTTSERREHAHESVPAPAGPAGTTKPLSKAAVARALGVTVGPSLLLDTLSIGGTLAAGETRAFPYAGSGTIWNNFEPDDGALYNPSGQLVSYFVDR